MRVNSSEEQQQFRSLYANLSRTRKKQIEREIIKRLSIKILKLAWFLIPLVILAVVYVKLQPAQTVAIKSTVAADSVKAKKIDHSATPTTVLSSITSTTLPSNIVKKEETETIFFLGLGNLSFGGQVAAMITSKGTQEPFSDISTILNNGDVAAGNLESVLAPGNSPTTERGYVVRGTPAMAAGMKKAGINLLSLSNDRILYFGGYGLRNTINLLDQAGIAHAGAGDTAQAAYTRTAIDIKGKKVAFLAFSSVNPDDEFATDGNPGVAGFPNRSDLRNIVKEAAAESDYLIVSCHWGEEFGTDITASQRKFAKRAIDAGADIVMGNHPHLMQGIELYNGRCIAYSMGDFVYTPGNGDSSEAFVLRLSLAKGMIVNAEVVPIVIDHSGKPSVATGCTATSILNRLRDLSSPFGTVVNIVGDTAQVH